MLWWLFHPFSCDSNHRDVKKGLLKVNRCHEDFISLYCAIYLQGENSNHSKLYDLCTQKQFLYNWRDESNIRDGIIVIIIMMFSTQRTFTIDSIVKRLIYIDKLGDWSGDSCLLSVEIKQLFVSYIFIAEHDRTMPWKLCSTWSHSFASPFRSIRQHN